MCTAISFHATNHYFGRNLDLEKTFIERVTITPRNFPLSFTETTGLKSHYAIIGMAAVIDNYPLYYDATNECGLSVAALNFPGNAIYRQPKSGCINIASFELIPWLLSKFSSVQQAQEALQNVNITNTAFSETIPPSPLHWIVSDERVTITIEATLDGLSILENPIHVLTNNPPFPYHLYNLQNYLNVSASEPNNHFSKSLPLKPHSRGMGSFSLPGDFSSSSRFIRAAFALHNTVPTKTEEDSITQFFHILRYVAMPMGCVRIKDGIEYTTYSSCCNTTKGIYYYTTYENQQITAVNMRNENLDLPSLISYPLIRTQKINMAN